MAHAMFGLTSSAIEKILSSAFTEYGRKIRETFDQGLQAPDLIFGFEALGGISRAKKNFFNKVLRHLKQWL